MTSPHLTSPNPLLTKERESKIMKTLFKTILQYYLKLITKLVLLIHRPVVIAVAGSTNKSFVKDEISKVLKEQGIKVRSNPSSFNTEIGLPLAILNLPSGYNSYKNWLPVIFKATTRLFEFNFPKYLVLELGVSDPGDMKYLLSLVKPRVAVVTDITQRYLEGFDDMDDLAEEYEYLVKKLNKNGLLVLNKDNPRVKLLANISQSKLEFCGISEEANWQAVKIEKNSRGMDVKVSHNDIVEKYSVNRFGNHHVYKLLIGLVINDHVKKEKKI